MYRIVILSIALLPLLFGCGSKRNKGGEVSGTITYKQQPVNGAVLHFHSTKEDAGEVIIPVSQEGTFSTSNVPPGDYKVVVEPSLPPPPNRTPPPKDPEARERFLQANKQEKATIAFPNKYKNLVNTDLQVTIKDGEQKLALELKDGR